MLLVGMVAASLVFGQLLGEFSQLRLIQVIQGAAVMTMAFNLVALWKQEARDPQRTRHDVSHPDFRAAWRGYRAEHGSLRALVAVGLGTAAFSMQDILLEPYGGEILRLSVGETTALTGMLAAGTIGGFVLAARLLVKGFDPYRLAGFGAAIGLLAFPALIAAGPLASAALFRAGTVLIGFGGGLFSVGTLTAAMALSSGGRSGLALGAWGSVQATAAGVAIALGGAIRDVVARLAAEGHLGAGLADPATGYNVVYNLEIVLLLATLIAIGPLVRPKCLSLPQPSPRFGLAEFPG
jgi:BCD family chlorophyll transporter-like MFS transporter